MKKVRKEAIEGIVLDESRKLYEDESLRSLFIKTFTAVFSKIMRGTVDKQASMENEISKLEERKRGALIAIADNPSLAAEMQSVISSINDKIKELNELLAMHKSALKNLKVREDDVKEFLDSVFRSDSSMSAEPRIIDSLVQRVDGSIREVRESITLTS